MNLVKKIEVLVIASFTYFIDKYPELKELLNNSSKYDPISEWDFYMTTAGVYMALQNSNEQLEKTDHKIIGALKDLNDFVDKNKNKNKNVAISIWVLWNLKGEKPNYKETKNLVPAISAYLLRAVTDLATA